MKLASHENHLILGMDHIELSHKMIQVYITVTKIYFLDDPSIQVHQSRVQHCPPSLPSELYWYGAKRSRPGRPSKKILKQLVPLVTEIEMPSLIRASAETGNDNTVSRRNFTGEKFSSRVESDKI